MTRVTEPDPDCENCDGTGHEDDCEARERAWDLTDLMMRRQCSGCCPKGHRPHGMQALQDRTAAKAQDLIGRRR